jgi:dolichol-phosphate mannosyltransferase
MANEESRKTIRDYRPQPTPGRLINPRAGVVRVVLPAYNEERSLPGLLNRLDVMFEESDLSVEVLVVNDGSTDRTVEVVERYDGPLPIRLIDCQPNRGLAETIRTGLRGALEQARPGDVIVTMDADNSHSPGLIPRMVSRIREGNDLVIASRYQRGSRIRGLSRFRRTMSYAASWLFRIFSGLPAVRDYTCGYRAYRAELLEAAFSRYGHELIQQTGFGCMAELLLKLKPLDPIIHEVPLILRYDMKQSDSKMKIARTVRETLLMLIRSKAARW